MQCRVNDIIINDVPKFLMKTPTHDSHSIVAQDINNPLTPLVLPLYIHGVTSWLPVSKTSLEDWNYMKYQTIEFPAEQLDWEPNDTRFQESEEAMISYGDHGFFRFLESCAVGFPVQLFSYQFNGLALHIVPVL